MARFPSSFLDEVLARTDLVELIGRHVELKKSGANLMGLCPFHHEKTPSFSVSPDKQLYYCFGCGKGGGAFQFLMEHDGYSFPEAVEYLAEKAGLEVPREAKEDKGEAARERAALALLEKAAHAFACMLDREGGAPARAWLDGRGLPESVWRAYGLGFAPEGYGFMERVFGRDARQLARLEAVGLMFRGERGYGDRFRGRVMFPIRDRRGRVVGFGGRVLGDGEPKYLNSPETPWFRKSELLYGLAEHRDAIRREGRLVVVEGYMDVLAMAAHGLKIGLAPLGTAIGERQLRQIFRLCDAPVFCFDGDRAGRQAAWRALERMLPLLSAEHAPRFLYLPEGEDPDSLLAAEGREAFEHRVRAEAKPALETWLDGLQLLAGRGPEGRARMAKKADGMLAGMTDDYLRQVWQGAIEEKTGVSLAHARRAARVAPPAREAADAARGAPPVQLREVEERFLAGLMQQPARFRHLPDDADMFFLDNPPVHRIYTRAFAIAADAEDDTKDIASRLIREFPEHQSLIARWMNQASVSGIEFESLKLDMEANHIRASLKRGGVSLEEALRLKARERAVFAERNRLKETLENGVA